MLNIVGIDLRGVQSLTLKALEILKGCSKIYLEVYTSLIQNSEGECYNVATDLSLLLQNNAQYITLKKDTSYYKNDIVQSAKDGFETAFIVLFDPLAFSNDTACIFSCAEDENVKYTLTHNTSMQTSIGRCGLTLVAFDAVNILFNDDKKSNAYFINEIKQNLKCGLHSFCRLDAKLTNNISEPTFNLMSCSYAASILLSGCDDVEGLEEDTFCVGMSRLGCDTERIFAGSLVEMTKSDSVLGGSLHCLVVVGNCHDLELTFLNQFRNIDNIKPVYDNCLHLIGLGLGGVEDLTLEAFTFLKTCQRIYLETYTSVVLNADGEFSDIITDLKSILCNDAEYVTADREMVEGGTEIVNSAKSGLKTAFLVVGDPLSSATHTDLIIRALEDGVGYKLINNTSIMTAVSCCGLRLMKYCQTVSIPYWDDSGKQTSIIDKIEFNLRRSKHTLCLLDIKVKERSIINILRDRKIYEPPRFMTCATAAEQLLECLDTEGLCLSKDTLCVGLARVGCRTQRIFCGSLEQVAASSQEKLGGPLHCLVIAGECSAEELAFLSHAADIDLETLNDLYGKHKSTLTNN